MRTFALLGATLAALAAGSTAAADAALWTPPRAATNAGSAYQPVATVGGGGRLAIAWVRRIHSVNRAEVREGTPARGLTSATTVVDSSQHLVSDPTLAFLDHRGSLAFAWRRFLDGNHRIRGLVVSPGLRARSAETLTGVGESAYSPTFIHSPKSLETVALSWSRRTRSELSNLSTSGYARPVTVAAAPIVAVQVAYDGAGAQVAVWSDGADILEAERPAGALAFGPPRIVVTVANATVVTTSMPNGAVAAIWASGGILTAAVRPPGGQFTPPVEIAAVAGTVRDLTATANAAGEILVVYRDVARGALTGAVDLLRLAPDGAPLGPVAALAPSRVRSAATLAADGTSGAFAGWTIGGVVHAVRIAPGGILGRVHTFAESSDGSAAPRLVGMPSSGAVATWVSGGRIVYSVDR